MGDHAASYIWKFLQEEYDSSASQDFLSQIPREIALQIISDIDVITEDMKNHLILETDKSRSRFLSENPDFLTTFNRIASSSFPNADFSKIFSVPDEGLTLFIKLYRAWKASMAINGLTISIFPGYPPQAKEGETEYNYYEPPPKKVNPSKSSGKSPAGSSEQKKFVNVRFPTNVDLETVVQINEEAALLFEYTEDDSYPDKLRGLIENAGFKFSFVNEEPVAEFRSYADMMRAEAVYIHKYAKFSPLYEAYLEARKGKLTGPDRKLKEMLEGIQKDMQEVSSDDEVSIHDEEIHTDDDRNKNNRNKDKKKEGEEDKTKKENEEVPEGSGGNEDKGNGDKTGSAGTSGGTGDGKAPPSSGDNNNKDSTKGPEGSESSAGPKTAYKDLFEEATKKLREKGMGGSFAVSFESVAYEPIMTEGPAPSPGRVIDQTNYPEQSRIIEINLPGKIMVGSGSDVYKSYSHTINGVRCFLRDNGLDETDLNDVIYGIIVTRLIEGKAILTNSEEEVGNPPDPAPKSLVTAGKLITYSPLAKRMIDTAMFYACQGARDGSLPWYESFVQVYGKPCNEKRFINLCELIVGSGILEYYASAMTVGYLQGINNLLKYRLSRISAPELIFRAFGMISEDFILRMVNPTSLRAYRRFLDAGIVAQVASGPLKVYCKGTVNCLAYKSLHPDTTIEMLSPIENPPHDVRLIKQAKIILDAYNVTINKWYQGEAAMATFDAKDQYFKEVVRAFKEVDAEKARLIAETISKSISVTDFGSDENVPVVKGLLASYGV